MRGLDCYRLDLQYKIQWGVAEGPTWKRRRWHYGVCCGLPTTWTFLHCTYMGILRQLLTMYWAYPPYNRATLWAGCGTFLMGTFRETSIQHIRRSHNSAADALSKLGIDAPQDGLHIEMIVDGCSHDACSLLFPWGGLLSWQLHLLCLPFNLGVSILG